MPRICVALALLLLFASCSKSKKPDAPAPNVDSPAQDGSIIIANHFPITANVFIYASVSDYVMRTNPIISTRLESGQSYDWTSANKRKFYIDWYTDDYSYSNWGVGYYSGFGNGITYVYDYVYDSVYVYPSEHHLLAGKDTLYLDYHGAGDASHFNNYKTNGLQTRLMHNTDTASTWTTIDVLNTAGQSIINSRKPDQPLFDINIQRTGVTTVIFDDSSRDHHERYHQGVRSGLAFNINTWNTADFMMYMQLHSPFRSYGQDTVCMFCEHAYINDTAYYILKRVR